MLFFHFIFTFFLLTSICTCKWDLGQKYNFLIPNLNTLGDDIAMAFPGIHALSRCDSKSAISGIGKVKMFKAVCKDKRFVNAVAFLGESLDLVMLLF